MGVDGVVAIAERAAEHGEGQQRIERNLRQRWSDFHAADEWRPHGPEHAQTRHGDIRAEWIRDQIDLMPKRRQRTDTVEFAERCPARLEKRLGSNHENAHVRVIFARNRSTLRFPLFRMSTEQTASSGFRRHAITALKLAVSGILLAVLFSRIDMATLWATARTASIPWLLVALAIYAMSIGVGIWRWHLLLEAQHVAVEIPILIKSFLVGLFFNNFLPSNIGGDVIRIRDTTKQAGSMTLAATIVLMDRMLGLIALALVAASGATLAAGGERRAALPILPAWLWAGFFVGAGVSAPAVISPTGFGRLLQPLRVIHPEWVDNRIEKLTGGLSRFREKPGALATCFSAAVFVQAATVLFYFSVAHALGIPIGPWDLAVIVPLSFVVQMAPVSINGFGVREAAFSLYFSRLGLPLESALLVSLVPTVLVMLFSLSGAVVYVVRGHRHA
jgi:uncharacterized membrane protein YbhN (UPF0104 family)